MNLLGNIKELIIYLRKAMDLSDRFSNKQSSLISKSKSLRVEPLVIVDNIAVNSEALGDVLQGLYSMFAGFYLQAIALSFSEADMHISEKLEPFSTKIDGDRVANRVINKYIDKKLGIANESFQQADSGAIQCISVESFAKLPVNIQQSINDLGIHVNVFTKQVTKISRATEDGSVEPDWSSSIKELKEKTNMSVGKIVNVTFKKEKMTSEGPVERIVQVPVIILLVVSQTKADNLKDIFVMPIENTTASQRKLAWQMGDLSFWDIIFCNDVYRRFRSNLMRDNTGYLKSNLSNQNSSIIYKMLMGKSSSAGVSSMFVIDSTTLTKVEASVGFKFNQAYGSRDKLMTTAGVMILVVIDEAYRTATFYFHSIEKPLIIGFPDLKRASSKDGSNITDIINALSMGQAPRL